MPGNDPSTHGQLSWLPGATALLAFIACNGTIVLVGLRSIFGITFAINPHVQAATISFFAVLTLAMVGGGFGKHRRPGPLLLSIAGALFVVGTMYISFN